MMIDVSAGEIRLADNSPISLRGGRGLRIVCTEGIIWITLAGEPGDIFLKPGQVHVVQGNGLAIVESIGCGSLRISKPEQQSLVQSWRATLRRLFAEEQQALLRS